MRLALFGNGAMGQLTGQRALDEGHEMALVLTRREAARSAFPELFQAALALMNLLEENFRLPLVPVQESARMHIREVLPQPAPLKGKKSCHCVKR